MLGQLFQHRQPAGSARLDAVFGLVETQRGSAPAAITCHHLVDDKDSAQAGVTLQLPSVPRKRAHGENEASRSDQRTEVTPLMAEEGDDKMKDDGRADAAVMSAQFLL